jgi:phenylacetate-coenzyme A ligase PaaK-like adenylate-forming protein
VAEDAARARLAQAMKDRLRARLGVTPIVELVAEGTLPRTEFKARRVIDDRDLYRQQIKERRDVRP